MKTKDMAQRLWNISQAIETPGQGGPHPETVVSICREAAQLLDQQQQATTLEKILEVCTVESVELTPGEVHYEARANNAEMVERQQRVELTLALKHRITCSPEQLGRALDSINTTTP